MATNNFKKLEEEAEEQHPHAPLDIEQNLMGNMRMTHFVGDVVELYLPRIFDMILSFFGASAKEENNRMDTSQMRKDSDDGPLGTAKSDG